jgi:hypothetical protein
LLPWLAASQEQVLDVPAGNFTHFDNVIAVEGREAAPRASPNWASGIRVLLALRRRVVIDAHGVEALASTEALRVA